MTPNGWLQIALPLLVVLALTKPLGAFMHRVFEGERHVLSGLLGPLERGLYRIKLDGSGLTRLSSEPGVHRISMSANTQFYLDRFSDVRTLPSLTLHRSDGGRQRSIAAPRMELLARFDMQYPELLTIQTADRFPMPACLLKPRDFRPDRKHPVILFVYGGASSPTVANAWQSDLLFNQLSAAVAILLQHAIRCADLLWCGASERAQLKLQGVASQFGQSEAPPAP